MATGPWHGNICVVFRPLLRLSGCPERWTDTLYLVCATGSTHNIREPVPVFGQPLALCVFDSAHFPPDSCISTLERWPCNLLAAF